MLKPAPPVSGEARVGELVRAASTTTAALMTTALAQRVVTFLLNVALLRYVSAGVVGFASNDMELYLGTILFLARESCRLVASRARAGLVTDALASPERAAFLRLAWLPVPLGVALILLVMGGTTAYGHLARNVFGGAEAAAAAAGPATPPEKAWSLAVYTAAIFLELCAEPWAIMANNALLPGLRSGAEVLGTTCKCILTFALVVFCDLKWGAFACGQLAFSVVLLGVYVVGLCRAVRSHNRQQQQGATNSGERGASPSAPQTGAGQVDAAWWLPSMPTEESTAAAATSPRREGASSLDAWLGAGVPAVFLGFSYQSLVKYFLTEGDRIVLLFATTEEQRGAYSVVVNYGSLPARFFFQPLEESLRNLVGKLSALASTAPAAPAAAAVAAAAGQSKAPTQTQRAKAAAAATDADAAADASLRAATLATSENYLNAALYMVTLVGFTCAALGLGYAPLASRFLFASDAWAQSELPAALALYCLYVPFLAVNGVTEAFSTALADTGRLAQANVHLLGSFLASAAVAAMALPAIGIRGVIAANCVNMALRTLSSAVFVAGRLRRRDAAIGGSGSAGDDGGKGKGDGAASAATIGWSWRKGFPSVWTLALLLLAGIAGLVSHSFWAAAIGASAPLTFKQLLLTPATMVHIGVGAACTLLLAASVYVNERATLRSAQRLLRGKLD